VHPLLKWTAIVTGGVAAVALIAVSTIYITSEIAIAKSYPLPAERFRTSVSASAEQGQHLALILGCTDCHGKTLQGKYLDFIPASTVYGANLPHLAETFTDTQFANAIRRGLRPDGTSLPVMPSNQYANLTDDETGSLIAYIRAIKSTEPATPSPSYGLFPRLGVLLGLFGTQEMERPKYKAPIDLGPATAQGRHIAMVACGECHTSTLGGQDDGVLKSPDLVVAAAYDRADFIRFMRTGKAIGDRELPLMSVTARTRFSHFTDAEVNALYDYLAARGQKIAME
jgi:cytochrome c553